MNNGVADTHANLATNEHIDMLVGWVSTAACERCLSQGCVAHLLCPACCGPARADGCARPAGRPPPRRPFGLRRPLRAVHAAAAAVQLQRARSARGGAAQRVGEGPGLDAGQSDAGDQVRRCGRRVPVRAATDLPCDLVLRRPSPIPCQMRSLMIPLISLRRRQGGRAMLLRQRLRGQPQHRRRLHQSPAGRHLRLRLRQRMLPRRQPGHALHGLVDESAGGTGRRVYGRERRTISHLRSLS